MTIEWSPESISRGTRRRSSKGSLLDEPSSGEANKLAQEMERQARFGDPATKALVPDWRERMEDTVWTLVNTPEFVLFPSFRYFVRL